MAVCCMYRCDFVLWLQCETFVVRKAPAVRVHECSSSSKPETTEASVLITSHKYLSQGTNCVPPSGRVVSSWRLRPCGTRGRPARVDTDGTSGHWCPRGRACQVSSSSAIGTATDTIKASTIHHMCASAAITQSLAHYAVVGSPMQAKISTQFCTIGNDMLGLAMPNSSLAIWHTCTGVKVGSMPS